jgi:hypothetical protein
MKRAAQGTNYNEAREDRRRHLEELIAQRDVWYDNLRRAERAFYASIGARNSNEEGYVCERNLSRAEVRSERARLNLACVELPPLEQHHKTWYAWFFGETQTAVREALFAHLNGVLDGTVKCALLREWRSRSVSTASFDSASSRRYVDFCNAFMHYLTNLLQQQFETRIPSPLCPNPLLRYEFIDFVLVRESLRWLMARRTGCLLEHADFYVDRRLPLERLRMPTRREVEVPELAREEWVRVGITVDKEEQDRVCAESTKAYDEAWAAIKQTLNQ